MEDTKRCSKCGSLKAKSEFHKDRHTEDGLTCACAECRRKNTKQWQAEHEDHRSEYGKRWREQNEEYDKERKRQWYLQEGRAETEQDRVRRWRENNRAYYLRYNTEYRKKKPSIISAIQNRRRAKELQAGGDYTSDEWESLKKRYEYTCLCCRRSEPEVRLEPDHVVPISRGGANSIDNIQPLCGQCNKRKNNKHVDYR